MSSFSVDILPNPAADHETLVQYSARLKALRLRSLREDTNAFISKYESEVSEPDDFWLDRLKFDRAFHLILGRHGAPESPKDLMQKEWVGFVVIIAPSRAGVESIGQPAAAEWEMAALYIQPELRGQGLGKRLVEATIEYVKEHGLVDGKTTPSCVTSVRHGNERALELYQRLGFRIIDSNEHVEKEGRSYLTTRLKIDVRRDQ
jgi:ribosomal protein S18 acetylase RimI-like enzyme